MITWPSELPLMQIGSTYSPVDPQLRTQSQSGRTIVRRLFSGTPENFDARWIMTGTQAIIFERFYRNDLENGSLWFDMPVWLPQIKGSRSVQFQGIYQRRQLAQGRERGLWEYTASMQMYLRALTAGSNF